MVLTLFENYIFLNEMINQLANKIDDMATHNKMLETQISQVWPNSKHPQLLLPGPEITSSPFALSRNFFHYYQTLLQQQQ